MAKITPVTKYLASVLNSTVVAGVSIPAHDETFEAAEELSILLGKFHAHIEKTRNKDQADAALLEFTEGISSAVYDVTRPNFKG